MVQNAGKWYLMCLGNNTENETFLFNNNLMENNNEQELTELIIDNKLNFKYLINDLCKRASPKIGAFRTLSSYLNSRKKVIFNSIIKVQFNYCPLVCMSAQEYRTT